MAMQTPAMRVSPENRRRLAELWRGLRAGLPVAAGYLPVAVAYGLLARQAGLTAAQALGMSAWVYAGASQFAALNLIGAGVPPAQIILATFLLNLRHLLMSTSLLHRLQARRAAGVLMAYGVTDETFVVASLGSLSRPAAGAAAASGRSSLPAAPGAASAIPAAGFLALIVLVYLAWSAGTLAGALLAGAVPAHLAASLGIGLYAMFIGLLVPTIRAEWRKGAIALGSALISWSLFRWAPAVSSGWRIIIATLAGSAAGLLLVRPEEDP